MDILRKYSEFEDFSDIEKLINNKEFVNFCVKIYSAFPQSLKSYITSINLDKLVNIEKRYDVFNKVEKLYNKGITSIKDIYNYISPKNESILLSVLSLIFIIWMTYLARKFYKTNVGKVKNKKRFLMTCIMSFYISITLPGQMINVIFDILSVGVETKASNKYINNTPQTNDNIEIVSDGDTCYVRIIENGDTSYVVAVKNKDGNYKIEKITQ